MGAVHCRNLLAFQSDFLMKEAPSGIQKALLTTALSGASPYQNGCFITLLNSVSRFLSNSALLHPHNDSKDNDQSHNAEQ